MELENAKALKNPMVSILKSFMFMWILTAIGAAIGSQLPPLVCFIMSIGSLVILIVAMFVKSKKTAKVLMYLVPFMTGFMLYYTMVTYISKLGVTSVMNIVLLTIVLFAGLGFVGYVAVKKNLSGMGIFLFYALLALIVISIFGIFFSTPILELVISSAGILIFTLYTLYDFNQIRHNQITEDEVPLVALNLYFDFLNLMLNLLRFFGVLPSLKD